MDMVRLSTCCLRFTGSSVRTSFLSLRIITVAFIKLCSSSWLLAPWYIPKTPWKSITSIRVNFNQLTFWEIKTLMKIEVTSKRSPSYTLAISVSIFMNVLIYSRIQCFKLSKYPKVKLAIREENRFTKHNQYMDVRTNIWPVYIAQSVEIKLEFQ